MRPAHVLCDIRLQRAQSNYISKMCIRDTSPTIASVETVRRGKVRRGKLYYLRDRVGRKAKIKERI